MQQSVMDGRSTILNCLLGTSSLNILYYENTKTHLHNNICQVYDIVIEKHIEMKFFTRTCKKMKSSLTNQSVLSQQCWFLDGSRFYNFFMRSHNTFLLHSNNIKCNARRYRNKYHSTDSDRYRSLANDAGSQSNRLTYRNDRPQIYLTLSIVDHTLGNMRNASICSRQNFSSTI